MKPRKKHVGWVVVRGKPDKPVYIDLCALCGKIVEDGRCTECQTEHETELK